MRIGRFAARALIGALFVGHGTQKLFGSFGGQGLEGTDAMMESLDMRPARENSLAAGVTEAGGGALLIAGLLTPAAAGALIGTMITAIRKVHVQHGLWSANGGYEYNLALIGALVAITEDGPGPFSLDHLLGIERKGSGWALGALAVGAAASTLAIELGRRGGSLTAAPVDDADADRSAGRHAADGLPPEDDDAASHHL